MVTATKDGGHDERENPCPSRVYDTRLISCKKFRIKIQLVNMSRFVIFQVLWLWNFHIVGKTVLLYLCFYVSITHQPSPMNYQLITITMQTHLHT